MSETTADLFLLSISKRTLSMPTLLPIIILLNLSLCQFPHSADPALPPMECFTEKTVKVDVPSSDETITIASRGLGAVLKVPPEPLEETGAPLSFILTTCAPNKSFVYPAGYKSLSPVYYIAANKPLRNEVEVLLEHNVNVESSEQAKEMVFCAAKCPEDGKEEIHFIPVPAGEFGVGKEHGSLKTNELGFLNAGTKAADTSEISKSMSPTQAMT